ncbi:hypothetical protein Pla52o_06440 [Novipirellula galeiformis]|uniref:Uncharacterized protein n=1 Tax=Novipirellula galeiformis TaxID=2528004 RepID=A0A5C6CVP5_9BACT|nr:hypothetical protein [Novipirellula galeiformis]TWU26789.1 hypothetical protein Pla52o_06440 [Novipirellula galeiformis]
MNRHTLFLTIPLAFAVGLQTRANGQQYANSVPPSQSVSGRTSIDTPQTRLRPIGSSSAVDRYRQTPPETARYRQTGGNDGSSQVRQAMMMAPQSVTAPQLPNDPNSLAPNSGGAGMGLPPNAFTPPGAASPSPNPPAYPPPLPSSPPVASPPVASPPVNPAPRATLPPNAFAPAAPPTSIQSGNPPGLPYHPNSSSDLTPLPTPELQTQFATMGNCACVSAPSGYSAAFGPQYVTPTSYSGPAACGVPATLPPTYAPAAILPPTGVAPPAVYGAPLAAGTAAPVPSLFTLGQEAYPVQVGQGLWGQPVAYVPGQGVRNWVRYFFP